MHENKHDTLFFFLTYLNHLSSLQLLHMTELSSFADQFAALHIDNALRRRDNSVYTMHLLNKQNNVQKSS